LPKPILPRASAFPVPLAAGNRFLMQDLAPPAPSPPDPAAGYPDALVDRLVVGCRIFLPDYRGGVAALRRTLEANLANGGTGTFAPFDCAFTCGETNGLMRLRGGLRLAPFGEGVCTTSESSVEVNLIEFLRDALAPGSPRGLDGGLNFVDVPGAARGGLLARQLAALAEALDDLVAAVSGGAGCAATAEFTLRQVEFNRDLPVPDARRLAHSLKHAPNPWQRVARARHYAPHPDLSLDGNDVTVTWPADANDLPMRLKFYAKRADRLRVEVCFDKSAAVAATLGGGRRIPSAADGAALAALLGSLAAACDPLLDAMEAHVAAVSGPQAGALELIVALAPLLRATAAPPVGRPGPRVGDAARDQALDALFHLLEVGRFDASALRTNGTVRKALHRIAVEGGLLAESRGRAALYTVPPGMSAARRLLAASLWPRAGADGAGERVEDGDD